MAKFHQIWSHWTVLSLIVKILSKGDVAREEPRRQPGAEINCLKGEKEPHLRDEEVGVAQAFGASVRGGRFAEGHVLEGDGKVVPRSVFQKTLGTIQV